MVSESEPKIMVSRILIAACAAIILFFGSVHLVYTFFTDQLTPVEGQMETAMKRVVPRISSGTTMWKAWVGFNVSHSMGLMLFGLIYGYLTVYQWEVLRRSYFLSGLGLLVLVGYVVLARAFWFKDPFGLSTATLLYVAGFIYAFARR
jgi:hypothetical protein